jgi:hypothetical protein
MIAMKLELSRECNKKDMNAINFNIRIPSHAKTLTSISDEIKAEKGRCRTFKERSLVGGELVLFGMTYALFSCQF